MGNKIMKIDRIELKFKDEKGHIKSLDEFSEMFEHGFYFVEHPKEMNGTRVIMCITSNFENRIFSFNFNRKDIEWGHYWIDKLVQKWTIIWEWYNQADIDSCKKFDTVSSTIEIIKKRFGEQSEEYRKQLALSLEVIEQSSDIEETSESKMNYNNMEWILEYDEKNSFERIRSEKIYFDNDLKVWIDLEYSLSAIREIIRKVDVYTRTYVED